MFFPFSTVVLLFDFLLGEPPETFHPTVWIGKLVSVLEKIIYIKKGVTAKISGSLLVLFVISLSGSAAYLLQEAFLAVFPDIVGNMLVAATASLAIGSRSLASHVRPVLKSLARFDLPEARRYLSRIVGRDTAQLDRGETSRAAVETAAESLGDGIIAPLFFFVLFGLPGIFIYRAANTMDSMIGHKDEKYCDFGWAAARFDDLLNFLPARLLGMPSIVLSSFFSGGNSFRSLSTAFKFHASHKSPNAGWYESAAAGSLGIRLGGTNFYNGEKYDLPLINPSGRKAVPADIRSVLRLLCFSSVTAAVFMDCLILCLSLI